MTKQQRIRELSDQLNELQLPSIYKRSENEKIPHERKCLTTRKDGTLIIKVGKDNNRTFMNVTTD